MSLFSRLRSIPNPKTPHLFLLRFLSSPSSILSPDSKTPLFSHEKSRAALSLLKSESNPSRIIDICRAASLSPSFHIDRIAFSVAISKLSKSNNFQFIREFLEESKTRADLKNESFYCHAIVLYGQANMIEEAKRTFKEMGESGMGFTPRGLNSLLFACILAKDYSELKRIYVEFPKIYSITPDIDTYNHVIKSFAESGSTSSSYSVLAEMDRKGVRPNAVTFGNMLAGFYKEEKMEDVGKVLNLMEDHRVKKGVSIYNIRIQSLCKLKKSYEAKGLLDAMLLKGMKPNSVTYTHLIHGYCNEGKYDEAKELFRSMVNKGCKPESDCYFTLIYFLCVGKDFESALNVCKESMENNWIPNFATMKLLVNGLAESGKLDEAKQLLKDVKERFSKNTHLWDEVEAALPQ